MKSLVDQLRNKQGGAIAVLSSSQALTYADLLTKVDLLSCWLTENNIELVCIHAQNSIDWIIIDLACQHANVILAPIPLFYTQAQTQDLLLSVKPNLLFSDSEGFSDVLDNVINNAINNVINKVINSAINNALSISLGNTIVKCEAVSLNMYRLSWNGKITAPTSTTKITYTSGSTGTPKGVCLSTSNQLRVAFELVDKIDIPSPKHLCLLPLPTLLENIAGVYAPLLSNGTVVVTSDEERGFEGSRLLKVNKLLECITLYQPNTLILVPELLQLLIMAIQNGWEAPKTLLFIAVGGSKVSPSLIKKARKLGLPVCQGYGLSECASVVSLATLDDNIFSAGKTLRHVDTKISNGELIVTGNTFLGYLEDPSSWYPDRVNTGDLARVDAGLLYIEGRLKNIIINSFGRNMSPEWIESELLSSGLFAQAVVIGDAKPFCTAILVPASSAITPDQISLQIAKINANLPDYAHIRSPITLSAPMDYKQGLYTANMRPRRDAIIKHFKKQIDAVYVG